MTLGGICTKILLIPVETRLDAVKTAFTELAKERAECFAELEEGYAKLEQRLEDKK